MLILVVQTTIDGHLSCGLTQLEEVSPLQWNERNVRGRENVVAFQDRERNSVRLITRVLDSFNGSRVAGVRALLMHFGKVASWTHKASLGLVASARFKVL